MEPRFNIILDEEIEAMLRKVMVRRLEAGIPSTIINKSVIMREALREGLGILLRQPAKGKENGISSAK